MDEGEPQRIDSRRWTGRGLGPTRAERQAAWRAFRAAAGPGGIAPRRAAAIACAAGALLVLPGLAAGSPEGAARLRGLIGPAPHLIAWLAAFVGPALLIALAASVASTVSAWRNRAALARGFAAAPLQDLERGGADVVLGLAAILYMAQGSNAAHVLVVGLLWIMAYFLSRGATLLAERCAAGLDKPVWPILTLGAIIASAAVSWWL